MNSVYNARVVIYNYDSIGEVIYNGFFRKEKYT